MMEAWTKTPWTDASQIVNLIDPATPLEPSTGKALPEFYANLVANEDLVEAITFMAHAMSRYDCVVWATRAMLETRAVERTDPLMVAVLRWVDNPEDDTIRRAAGDMAQAEVRSSPAKMLANAVFFSGGSLSAAELPGVQPAPDVCAKLAGAAVLSAMYQTADAKAALRQALSIGEAIVTGSA